MGGDDLYPITGTIVSDIDSQNKDLTILSHTAVLSTCPVLRPDITLFGLQITKKNRKSQKQSSHI